MRKTRSIVCLIALALPLHFGAAAGDSFERNDALKGMKKAARFMESISTKGGYIGMWSLDLKTRHGEKKQEMSESQIWIQPPGTPSVGATFLLAFEATGDPWYLERATEVARALAWTQLESGGWNPKGEMEGFRPDALPRKKRKTGYCAFDDDATQGALRFLMDLNEAHPEDWLKATIDIGMGHTLKSQFANGAWPQYFPLREKGYSQFYTFNDSAINDCLAVMLKAHKLYGQREYLQSAEKAGDFIILSQVAAPQSGWAQQYDRDIQPAWARAFEPPGVSGLVTANNINSLVDLYLYTKNEKYLKPIPAALDWLKRSEVAPKVWNRLYEIGTNRPIFGDRDGKIHYTLAEISEERRNGYSWRSSYGVPSAIARYKKVRDLGAELYLTRQAASAAKERANATRPDFPREILDSMDQKGRWVRDDTIHISDFVSNMRKLCSFLEKTRPLPEPRESR